MKTEYSCKRNANNFKIKIYLFVVILLIVLRLVSNIEFTCDRYAAAFEALGEGLNGEQAFSDAVKDAYTYAFLENEERLIYAAGIKNEEKIER